MTELDPHDHYAEDAELEELVAYLDGELESERATRVEERLATDPAYRTRLRELARTWEMLDHLPQSSVSEHFTETTVELVAVQAEKDLRTQQVAVVRKQQSVRLVLAMVAVVSCLAGFGLIWSWQQRGERRFLRDLPIIEELDMYRVADSVDFLQSLEERGLFTENEEINDGDL